MERFRIPRNGAIRVLRRLDPLHRRFAGLRLGEISPRRLRARSGWKIVHSLLERIVGRPGPFAGCQPAIGLIVFWSISRRTMERLSCCVLTVARRSVSEAATARIGAPSAQRNRRIIWGNAYVQTAKMEGNRRHLAGRPHVAQRRAAR